MNGPCNLVCLSLAPSALKQFEELNYSAKWNILFRGVNFQNFIAVKSFMLKMRLTKKLNLCTNFQPITICRIILFYT
jgi:hypothetical protein